MLAWPEKVAIGTSSVVRDAVAVGARFQHSFGGRYILQMDAFGRARDETGFGAGIRSEFRIQF